MLSRGETKSGNGGWDQIQAYRQLMYARMRRKLAALQKNAALKSGSRGSQARKELLAFEKLAEEAKERYVSNISSINYAGVLIKGKVLGARNLRWPPRNVRTS